MGNRGTQYIVSSGCHNSRSFDSLSDSQPLLHCASPCPSLPLLTYHFLGNNFQKRIKVHSTTSVNLCEYLLDFIPFNFEPQNSHCHLELLCSNRARTIGIKQVKCFTKFLVLIRSYVILGLLFLTAGGRFPVRLYSIG